MNWSIRKLAKKEFPPPLLEIPQTPKDLHLVGKLPSLEKFVYLAVVGSRKYSNYGKEVCEKLIAGLTGYPVVIVSGLAFGIDAIAHKAALNAGLLTVAFPGSGLDPHIIYPSANRKLAEEIITKGGALVSEYEPKTIATPYTFPQRNRLMAGLSKATLIIEAGEKSGTLITARLALDYNRDVLVVPGPIFSPSSRGSNSLLRLGATPITSSQDLLLALGFEAEGQGEKESYKDLSPKEKKVVEILSVEATPRDELIEKIKMPAHEANVLLSMMEIKGLIKETLGEIRLA